MVTNAAADPTAPSSSDTGKVASSDDVPKKSDILLKREQVKREQAARLATQAGSSNSIPARHEPSRNMSSHHGLPARPEPGNPRLERQRPPPSDDRRAVSHDRSMDRSREPQRELIGDRRMESSPRDNGGPARPSESSNNQSRHEHPARWSNQMQGRDPSEKTPFDRTSNFNGRLSREGPMPPPKQPNLPAKAPFHGSQRGQAMENERPDSVFPARAANISSAEQSRSNSPRVGEERTRDRHVRGSSPASVRWHEDQNYTGQGREERPPRGARTDSDRPTPSRLDGNQLPPSGPRSEGQAPRARAQSLERRESNPQVGQGRAPFESNHGRLNTSRQQPDPNYGRLNSIPSPEIPSGPRERSFGRGGARNASGYHQSHREVRPSEPIAPPTPDRGGPATPAERGTQRDPTGPAANINTSMTSTPDLSQATPSPSIHPDRLRQLPAAGLPAPPIPSPTQTSYQNQGSNMGQAAPRPNAFPDHAHGFDNRPNPRNQYGHNRPRQESFGNSSMMGGPPSGPKSVHQNNNPAAAALQPVNTLPVAPNNRANGFTAPPANVTGPAPGDRDQARIKNEINSLLKGSMDTSYAGERVRGRRAVGQAATPTSGPSTPVPQNGRAAETINPERAEMIGGSLSENRGRSDRSDRHRGGRHSHHSSRRGSRSPPHASTATIPDRRELKRGVGNFGPEGDRGHWDRDRRVSDRSSERAGGWERHAPHDAGPPQDFSTMPRESRRENGRGGYDGNWGSGHKHRESRGEGHRGGAGGGGGSWDDGGARKRRSEGEALEPRGYEKKPRRN